MLTQVNIVPIVSTITVDSVGGAHDVVVMTGGRLKLSWIGLMLEYQDQKKD